MTLFASVLRLDRAASKALNIKDTYSLHRVVYSLFEDVRNEQEKQASKSSGIQWVDKGGDATCRQILMLSNRAPMEQVNNQHGEVVTKCLPEGFLNHRTYRFEVVLNPVRRDRQTKKNVPIKGRKEIVQWFISRGQESWGFSVNADQLQVEQVRVLQFEAKHRVTLQQAKLSGYLTVTDSEAFAHSVANGIGRGRSFGCGLLQIVPVIESPLF
ncbi:type I-E CRISPR-associated protein Cas6/Cse3/CasE (plasmid) [Vibrio azureus]|uniref:Putative CRISPR-associated protein n=1 Tax=Vibrio azureus NBRC 104587 TaxID=1219077 RepID=U3AX27_9VIBR|nr:type I-E CRISPR-associated protein Cas6/Cse3/CasE [Vibrio azureus]AUI88998.1 type I-E CRISPR-associated protein Cas6/Cse3/CasE [Vibrio azureus]GAD77772.1 putative CRISPR-associated protein [Vibrio azureus NBRC 104587]